MPKDIDPQVSAGRFPLHRAYVQANGESFHVIEQGEGPAVLFCHGFPDTAETWRSQMRAVAEAGYHAVALDMRGFGASYAPSDVSLYRALHTVGDLVGVLDALDIRSAVLVGHDWGADVAARAMVMRPDRFRAIVSVSIPFQPRGEISTWDELRGQGLGERYYAFALMEPGAEANFEPASETIPSDLYWLSGSPPPGTGWDPVDSARHMLRPSPVAVPSWADPAYVQHTIRAFEKTGFHGGLNYYRAAQETFDLMPAFRNALIRQPSLYIWGAADGLCQLFHPTPPTLGEVRRLAPGIVDVVRLEDVGHWPQHEAAERVNAELLKFLDTIGSPPASDGPDSVAESVNSSLTTVNEKTDMTLETAIRARDLAAVVGLLRAGTDVNRRGPEGLTPLMIAAGLGQAQMVELLLTAGAEVLAIEPRMGATALHKGAQSGNADVIGLVLNHGAFIDQQSPVLGNTSLIDAVLHKQEEAVRLLLDRGARTTIRNHWQQTAFELAQHDGLVAIARLIEARNEKDAEQVRALTLMSAVKAGDIGEVKRLIEVGASVNERAPTVGNLDDDYTPLGIATREGHTDVVRVLLDAGADPRRVIGLMKGTPLHEASYFGRADIVQALTENHGHATELDAQGPYNGLTALHDAVWHGHLQAAQALVKAGARLDLITHAGLTPRTLAILYSYDDLAEFHAEVERR
jgi:pimeloyl-ACP methyl ester carboxylesterase/ankyrin repeat protein